MREEVFLRNLLLRLIPVETSSMLRGITVRRDVPLRVRVWDRLSEGEDYGHGKGKGH